jgi:hypothetical protein
MPEKAVGVGEVERVVRVGLRFIVVGDVLLLWILGVGYSGGRRT